MRPHDWSGFATLGAFIAAIVAATGGAWWWTVAWLVVVALGGAMTRYWSITPRAPLPYLLRWTMLMPRGNQSPRHVVRALAQRPGERVLELGPGVGVHAVDVARALGPTGRLDVFDVQQPMLDAVVRRAAAEGLGNVVPSRGDAATLPYLDATFDAAYLLGVLGEIPDEQAALRELRRVLKLDGRLVVGEVIFDPDYVPPRTLARRAAAASFAVERRLGSALSYLARLRPI
jgi:ubiquinone/menaquinone biosynthesis C-methylase UbiE